MMSGNKDPLRTTSTWPVTENKRPTHSSLWCFYMWSTIVVCDLHLPRFTVTCSLRSWSVDSFTTLSRVKHTQNHDLTTGRDRWRNVSLQVSWVWISWNSTRPGWWLSRSSRSHNLKFVLQYIHRHLFRVITVLHFSPRLDHHSAKMGPRPRHRFLILSLEDVNIDRWCQEMSVPDAPTCVPSVPRHPSFTGRRGKKRFFFPPWFHHSGSS